MLPHHTSGTTGPQPKVTVQNIKLLLTQGNMATSKVILLLLLKQLACKNAGALYCSSITLCV